MPHEVRLEVNIDVIKNDIDPETVRKVITNVLKAHEVQYIEVQSVRLIR